jgi:periplasmic copper chaperone A
MRFIITALLLAVAVPATAHIVVAPDRGSAGSYQAIVFRVGHGCGDAATTAITVELPEALATARPQPKPGWTLVIVRVPFASPATVEGKPQTTRVGSITWTGSLPADQFDDFGLLLKLPATAGPIALPVVQRCGAVEQRWDGAAGSSRPAPVFTVEPKDGMAEHQH